jgi:hypothetical protein
MHVGGNHHTSYCVTRITTTATMAQQATTQGIHNIIPYSHIMHHPIYKINFCHVILQHYHITLLKTCHPAESENLDFLFLPVTALVIMRAVSAPDVEGIDAGTAD